MAISVQTDISQRRTIRYTYREKIHTLALVIVPIGHAEKNNEQITTFYKITSRKGKRLREII
jgi:hypothetical protein